MCGIDGKRAHRRRCRQTISTRVAACVGTLLISLPGDIGGNFCMRNVAAASSGHDEPLFYLRPAQYKQSIRRTYSQQRQGSLLQELSCDNLAARSASSRMNHADGDNGAETSSTAAEDGVTTASFRHGRTVSNSTSTHDMVTSTITPSSPQQRARKGGGFRSNCIEDFTTLVSELQNAADDSRIILCPGVIPVLHEIFITANRLTLSCQNRFRMGTCVLERVSPNPANTNPNGQDDFGRILHVQGDGIKLRGIQFRNAVASAGSGGAVYINTDRGFGDISIYGCRFFNNNAPSGSGGALFIEYHGCNISIERTRFVNNSAGVNGGALAVMGSPLCRIGCYFIQKCQFQSNRAEKGHGGAVFTNFWFCGQEVKVAENAADQGFCPDVAKVSADGRVTCNMCT